MTLTQQTTLMLLDRMKEAVKFDVDIADTLLESIQDIFLHKPDSMTASEALYGFMGWLTAREEPTPQFSCYHDASEAAHLVAEFCETNKLADPRDGWNNNLIHPSGECSGRAK